MLKKVKVAVTSAVLLGVAAIANAAPTEFELPDLPMGQIYTLGGTVLTGLAVMWGYRKIVKSINRS